VVGGLPGPVTADYEAFHLVRFEFLLGSHGGRGFEGGRWLGEERVRGDWRYESIVGCHDFSVLYEKGTSMIVKRGGKRKVVHINTVKISKWYHTRDVLEQWFIFS
jgi:hypothetical protein